MHGQQNIKKKLLLLADISQVQTQYYLTLDPVNDSLRLVPRRPA